jgi:hypothetical protein
MVRAPGLPQLDAQSAADRRHSSRPRRPPAGNAARRRRHRAHSAHRRVTHLEIDITDATDDGGPGHRGTLGQRLTGLGVPTPSAPDTPGSI